MRHTQYITNFSNLLDNVYKYYSYYYDTSIRRENRKYLSTPWIFISHLHNVTGLHIWYSESTSTYN